MKQCSAALLFLLAGTFTVAKAQAPQPENVAQRVAAAAKEIPALAKKLGTAAVSGEIQMHVTGPQWTPPLATRRLGSGGGDGGSGGGVADNGATGFASNSKALSGVKSAVAAMAHTDVSKVTASMHTLLAPNPAASTATHGRRLQIVTDRVQVNYKVEDSDMNETEASSIKDALLSKDFGALTSAISAALLANGAWGYTVSVDNHTVTVISEEVAQDDGGAASWIVPVAVGCVAVCLCAAIGLWAGGFCTSEKPKKKKRSKKDKESTTEVAAVARDETAGLLQAAQAPAQALPVSVPSVPQPVYMSQPVVATNMQPYMVASPVRASPVTYAASPAVYQVASPQAASQPGPYVIVQQQ